MKRLAFSVVSACVLLGSTAAHATDVKSCIKSAEASQDLRDKGQYLRARQELLTCSNEACPPQVRSDCLTWLNELDRTAPSVVVHPKGPKGDDLVDVAVFLDGAQLVSRLDGKPILVDPGAHTFRYESAGMQPIEQKVLVNAGEKFRVLEINFAAVGGPDKPQKVPTPEPEPSHGGPPTLAWVLGGVAVVAIGTSAVFAISGLSKRSDLWSSPCSDTKTCSQSDVDSVKTKFLIADVAGAVGIVSAAAATYLFVTAPKAGSSATVGIGVLPGGGAVRYSGAF